jgi:precorrin-2/cobalt-factor-2 C20-methyltransferase
MTVYGLGLGPGEADLVTVRGKRLLESVDTVYSPGRLSRSVALNHVSESQLGDLDFPMTRDEETLRRAWRAAAEDVAAGAESEDVAFVTLGDPNIYSTFGHLRRTLAAFHPEVDVEVVPGVSAVTAFATALGVEIESGTGLALREAADGAAPTGPDRMILFKVTDAVATDESLSAAGYDVTYGRRLFMEQGDTTVTTDPEEIAGRDYYTLAYAERRSFERDLVTAAFDGVDDATADAGSSVTDTGSVGADAAGGGLTADGGEAGPTGAETGGSE